MFAVRRVASKQIFKTTPSYVIRKCGITGIICSVVWDQPKYIDRQTNKLWQVFDIFGAQNLPEVIRCTGMAPANLRPGKAVNFEGKLIYNEAKQRDTFKAYDIELIDGGSDDELIEISKYSKVSFLKLLKLRKQFGDNLVNVIQNSPKSISVVPGIGPVTAQSLQKALQKSSINVPPPLEGNQSVKSFKQKEKKVKKKTCTTLNEYIDDWRCDDHNAVDTWFHYQKQQQPLPMFCWNDYYAPQRKLIGIIENYINDKTIQSGNGIDVNILLNQSQIFKNKLNSGCDIGMDTDNITRLMSAYDYLMQSTNEWKQRLYGQSKNNQKLIRIIHILMNDTEFEQIACVDTEFFLGKYKPKYFNMSTDIAIGKLYNIGIATNNGKQISILIKHPTLSLQDRLKLFANYHGKWLMVEFVKPILQYNINEERMETVDVNQMSEYELEVYFNRYAYTPRQAWDVISGHLENYKYLMHHFSHYDQELIELLAIFVGKEDELKQFEWYNTSKLCSAMFPKNEVVSRSLSYLSKRLCKNINLKEHEGSSDAMALLRLLQTLRAKLIDCNVGLPNDQNSNSLELELQDWLQDKLQDPNYVAIFDAMKNADNLDKSNTSSK